mmetsp:Transcript_17931/g.36400  ORF Transcript_17931/g.36400 Transcript_17931/m.36400 type:complete len:342 (+) Transcript_17931:202-1227(+)
MAVTRSSSSGKSRRRSKSPSRPRSSASQKTKKGPSTNGSAAVNAKHMAPLPTSPSKSKAARIAPPSKTTKGAVASLFLITLLTFPTSSSSLTLQVFFYGWLTCLSTGLGVLPLVLLGDLDDYWLGLSNAVASGMMMSASYSLCEEGWTSGEDGTGGLRTVLGIGIGLVFIYITKSFLDAHESLKLEGLPDGADARRLLLIVFVMTLHSFSEGVGIGVSFGGPNGPKLGKFISASLAVHNVPEGLAVAVAMLGKGFSLLVIGLWCVLTSLPQPLMAVPSFLFVETFLPILPVGLGFAGGAMAFVAVGELFFESLEAVKDARAVCAVVFVSGLAMRIMQEMLH